MRISPRVLGRSGVVAMESLGSQEFDQFLMMKWREVQQSLLHEVSRRPDCCPARGRDTSAKPHRCMTVLDPSIVRLTLMLHEFIAANREELIRLCRAKVATRSAPAPTEAEIDHGVPMFLDQLSDMLRLGLTSTTEISETAIQHGHDLLLQGFTMSQVVHDYGDICQSIIELATEMKTSISPDDFRMLNRCLDYDGAGACT